MANGWAQDGAVQDQIDDTIADAVKTARARLPLRSTTVATLTRRSPMMAGSMGRPSGRAVALTSRSFTTFGGGWQRSCARLPTASM